MERRLKTCAVIFLIVICSSGQLAAESSDSHASNDEQLIRKAIDGPYIEGLQTRDFEMIRTVCIPEAVLMSVGEDEKLHVTKLDKWEKRFDPKTPPFQTLDYTILRIDAEGTAAQVKVLFVVDGSKRVIDFLNLLKVEGHWRVVNIIDF